MVTVQGEADRLQPAVSCSLVLVPSSCSISLVLCGCRRPLFIGARLSFPAHSAGREATLAVTLAPKLVLDPRGLGPQKGAKLPAWQQGDVLGDVSFVGLCRPSPLSPKRKALGGALAVAVARRALYTQGETFGKGALRSCRALVLARRDGCVIRTWCVFPREGGFSGEEQLSMQVSSPEDSPQVFP